MPYRPSLQSRIEKPLATSLSGDSISMDVLGIYHTPTLSTPA